MRSILVFFAFAISAPAATIQIDWNEGPVEALITLDSDTDTATIDFISGTATNHWNYTSDPLTMDAYSAGAVPFDLLDSHVADLPSLLAAGLGTTFAFVDDLTSAGHTYVEGTNTGTFNPGFGGFGLLSSNFVSFVGDAAPLNPYGIHFPNSAGSGAVYVPDSVVAVAVPEPSANMLIVMAGISYLCYYTALSARGKC